MIVGVKTEVSAKTNPAAIEQLKNLKAMYNIEYHQLEKLMNI
jgi:hypothetical protein